jgi:NTE family protein
MGTRALVLGGGGPVGIAWESGLIAGLEAEGLDLREADLIVGTSAGSMVGAQLALGESGASMKGIQFAQASRPRARDVNTAGLRPGGGMSGLMELLAQRPAQGEPEETFRAKIGAFALAAKTASEEVFIASFGHLAEVDGWPDGNFVCTAVDALDGGFVAWDRDAHVPLVRAVASSCSVPGIFPPITIDGRRYIDGGMRSATNADLARGFDVVVVVSVFAPEMGAEFGQRLEAELDALRESGSEVLLIAADEASRGAFGPNLMDASRRGVVAEAGARQGGSEAARLKELWSSK